MWVTKKGFFSVVFLASILGGLTVYLMIEVYGSKQSPQKNYVSISQKQASYPEREINVRVPEAINFEAAAKKVIPGVVHIQAYNGGTDASNPIESFFGPQGGSSGSGVIISDDGYIATNFHVVDGAERIEVILSDNRSYFASLVGEDQTTDLALLRIDERNLPYVSYGNSDFVEPGEWVLAIGNPFDLNSTVTAGIVSAKARNIGILRTRSNLQIESFIQTDAAVNPGNSGGALVDLQGKLVGINTAIATQSGTYEGYSFAVPVTLVRKVMDDLLEYGEVKRGLLGVIINDVNARIAESRDLPVVNGVLIRSVNENSAAKEAGIQEGDVIIQVNDNLVTNTSELQELVARNRPGDKVNISLLRDGKKKEVTVVLRNILGDSEIQPRPKKLTIRGATMETLPNEVGIMITELSEGYWEENDFQEGDQITHVDKARIFSVDELDNALERKGGGVMLEGIDKDGEPFYRALKW